MTYAEALDILHEDSERLNQEGEILAEIGSSAFYGGAQGNDGYDAMQIAREQFYTPEYDAWLVGWTVKVRQADETIAWFNSIVPETV